MVVAKATALFQITYGTHITAGHATAIVIISIHNIVLTSVIRSGLGWGGVGWGGLGRIGVLYRPAGRPTVVFVPDND